MYFGEGKQLRAKEMAKETFSFEMTYSLKQNAGFSYQRKHQQDFP